jgi:ligand-binding sensor domain-containing protein/two-component sensor histidine kinase
MTLRFRHVLFLSFLLTSWAFDARAQRLPITTFATANGLASNTVNRIVRDSEGFLWFCTAGGLSRFDGYEFANFGTEQGLPHSSVNDFLETRAGQYWIATDAGLVRFDPKGQPNRRLANESAAATSRAMFTVVAVDDPSGRASAITVLREGRDGIIWAGTNNGLYRLDLRRGGHVLRPVDIHLPNAFPEQRIISDLLEDSRGSLWIAAPSGLYRRWPDGNSARYTKQDGLPADYLSDLLEDHEGHLWAGTRLAGFFRFTVDDSHRAPVVDISYEYQGPQSNDLRTSWIYQLFETADHRFWIATARGLAEFFPGASKEPRFRDYSEVNGLTDYNITALNEDAGGNLWIGTFAAGAMKLSRGGFDNYGKQDGLGPVNDIFEDRAGRLCFKGSVAGDARTSVFEGGKLDPLSGEPPTLHIRLGCFDGKRFDWFRPEAVSKLGWNAGWVMEQVTLQARNNEWWIGTSEGLYRFPPSRFLSQIKKARPLAVYTMKDGLAALQVFRLFEDSRANIWISTIAADTNGLARWDAKTEKILDLTNAPGLPSFKDDRPRSFVEDRSGNVWIGFNHGLVRYARGNFKFFSASEGLPPGRIMNIHVDRTGRIWLASDAAGLIRVEQSNDEHPTFVSYSTAQGLSSNNEEVIAEDTGGRLYVGGGHGLDQLDPSTGDVRHFGTSDGLSSGLFRTAFRDRSGVLWFGMTSGLARFAPTVLKKPEPPPVMITGLRLSGVPEPVSAVGERDMSLGDFTPDQNQLQIDFVALGFGTGDVLRYQYKLDGADTKWGALSEQRRVTYASLRPGRYKFNVRAINADGIVTEHPASIAFAILSPVWMRWWFLTLSAFAICLAAFALYRYRVTRVLEMANMRTRIATDLHDDIGANLTRIALLSEVANKLEAAASRQPDADAPLASISRIARESVSSMSDIVWAINPKRESLLDLTRRMRQHADELFTLRNIDLRFDAPVAAENLKLGVEVRRDVLLIFKEAVNNAARHSQCSHVDIRLRVEASRLILSIVDDGIGFDTSKETEGNGVLSMRRRAQRLNGMLEVRSPNGSGTAVKLDIPQ